ncbi:hypothetical protein DH2020_049795 [Rehmannia glutinosa]|uniref:Uncharacterized protein n=1 Tax=Rehmannia glutinosa TaxID=99300 RepID=A0ABR0U2M4_REHGL
MDLESGSYQNQLKKESWRTILTLAYQSLGVVYGDLSTSPLYVYQVTFSEDIEHSETNEEIYGVFQLADEDLSTYKKDITSPEPSTFGARLKSTLEKYRVLQRFLLVLALLGACMVIGDVFSAVSGVEVATAKEHHKYIEVPVACFILIALFALQHYGTHRVGFLFAPVVLTWLFCIAAIDSLHIFRLSITGPCIYGASRLSFKHHDIQHDYRVGFYISVPGLAVITVMLVTTCLMSLVIVLCWHRTVLMAILFVFFFGTIEALYFSASLTKFLEGAWVPIALSFIFMIVMSVWHYGTLKTYEFDVQNKVSVDWLLGLGPDLGIVRVRGVGLIHTELVSGIPAIFSHFVTNLPAFHQVLVFLCVKSVPVPHVKHEERFLVGHIGPKDYRIYRCIVRYGYRDAHKDDLQFENDLICSIAEFIRTGKASPSDSDKDSTRQIEEMVVVGTPSTHLGGIRLSEDDVANSDLPGTSELREIRSPPAIKTRKRVRFVIPESPKIEKGARDELRELMEAREAGIAYILGHSYVRAKQGSSLIKKMVINLGYDFLRRNCRAPTYALSVPHASTLEVGMVYHI